MLRIALGFKLTYALSLVSSLSACTLLIDPGDPPQSAVPVTPEAGGVMSGVMGGEAPQMGGMMGGEVPQMGGVMGGMMGGEAPQMGGMMGGMMGRAECTSDRDCVVGQICAYTTLGNWCAPDPRNGMMEMCQQELCNDTDDDCDGVVDEGFEQVGSSCRRSLSGCSTEGVYVCTMLGNITCDAPEPMVSPEVCDMFDNDCDFFIDEEGC